MVFLGLAIFYALSLAMTPLGAAATQIYALANAWGQAGVDFSGIIQTLRGMEPKG